jgi:tetratricopeptide (TPR) repeat protein/tRNA A-37 threonylcarbamoyl transferase component Bud32
MSEHAEPATRTDPGPYPFLRPAEHADEIGRLGPYRVLEVLGSGGMGIVFRAEDVRLRRLVALKVMKPVLAAEDTSRRRFLREARLAGAVRHDHIVTAHEVGEDGGVPFLAMQLLRGESLEDRLGRDGRLPMAEVLRLGRQAAEGLAAAHARGLVHRDVKPSNIWLEDCSDGQLAATGGPPVAPEFRVKLLDFGLARSGDSETRLTDLDALIGTPGYMAPELAGGDRVDHRCDLFSLGCVLYRACTGQLPFPGEDAMAVLLAMAEADPKPPHAIDAELPPRLSDLILALLAREPAGRPPSAVAVAEALEDIGKGVPVSPAGPGSVAPRGRRPGRRRLAAVVLLVGVLLLAGAGAAVAFRAWARAREADSWQAWERRAGEHAQAQRWAEAADAYTEAIKRKGDEAGLWQERGRANLALGRWDEAVRDGTEAVRLDARATAGYNVRAAAYARLGQHERNIADLSELIRLQPESAEARARRGLAYSSVRDYGSAAADLGEAIRLDPGKADYRAARGKLYVRLKQWDRAVADCSEALRLDPKRAECYSDRGWAAHSLAEENCPQAVVDLTRAIDLDPDAAEAYHRRGHVYAAHLHQYDRAVADYTEAIKLDPDRTNYYLDLGWLVHQLGKFDEAVDDFNKALKLDPNSAQAHLYRGHVHANHLRQPDRALVDFNGVIRLAPAGSSLQGVAYWELGFLRWARKEYEQAVDAFTAAVERGPRTATYHDALARILATCPEEGWRDGANAVDHARRACELTSWKKAEYLDTLAAAYAEDGKFDEAVKRQMEALERAAENTRHDERLLTEMRQRLELYQARKPCREESGRRAGTAADN